MIKSLQKRFILLTISALLVVLIIIISGINIANYKSIVKEADYILTYLSKHEGNFPEFKGKKPEKSSSTEDEPTKEDGPPERKPEQKKEPPRSMLMELPYETRYFSVLLTKDTGSVLETNLEQIVSIDKETAIEYAGQVFSQNNTAGFMNRFRYRCQEEGSNIRIIFLDCGRKIIYTRKFVLNSTGVSLLVFAGVTLIVIFLSNRIVQPISESYEKQKRFITDASHEIKTPLTIINADADILEMELEDNEWITDIKKQTQRLTELTNNLLLLTRMEESDKAIQKIEFPISDVVNEAALSFQALAQTQNKTLGLNIQPMLSIKGDSQRIHQLTTLLLDNAIKYSPADSTVFVSLEKLQNNKTIQLLVTNRTLTPLTKENLHSLFDRFYRTDSSRNSSNGGHGIGLSVAKAIVDSHHGKIKALSENGDILTIQVQLPI